MSTNNFYNVQLNNFERTEELNNAIYDRSFPSNNLTMNFSFRPVNTKYTLMPTINKELKSNVPINNYGVLFFEFSITELKNYIFFAY